MLGNVYFIINIISSIVCLSIVISCICDLINGKMVRMIKISSYSVIFILSLSYCLIKLAKDIFIRSL